MNPLDAFPADAPRGSSTALAAPARRIDALAWQQEMSRASAWAVTPALQPRPVGELHEAISTPAFVAEPGDPRIGRAARPPVRLHVQCESESVQVWLGIDARAATALPHLVQALARWATGLGLRLGPVVCNGRDVLVDTSPSHHPRRLEWPASDPSAETPPLSRAAPSACRTSCASCSRS